MVNHTKKVLIEFPIPVTLLSIYDVTKVVMSEGIYLQFVGKYII